MQTFFPYLDPKKTAATLDQKRLGKQRVEAIQIARALLGLSTGWKHHPFTIRWKGYEAYLVRIYLRAIMDEWINRGYKNAKCEEHYQNLINIVPQKTITPPWLTDEFCQEHRQILFKKDPQIYSHLGGNER